jgi:hypothetical protein
LNKQMPLDAIESYRGFAIDGDRLVAPITGVEWYPGINASECSKCFGAPRRRCTCGFYSFRTEVLAIREWEDA